MFVKVKSFDNEEMYINPSNVALMKWHPSEKKPTAGIVILPSGKEYFLTKETFRTLLESVENESQATIKTST